MDTIIDKQFENGKSLISFLIDKKEITFYDEAENNFRKNLLLSVASFFEKRISETILKFASQCSKSNKLLGSLIHSKVIDRQYHAYFQWDGRNANKFFSHFGDDFKVECEKLIKSDIELQNAIKAFLELGNERNKLVHQNFGEYPLEKTADDIYDLYNKSLIFVEFFETQLLKS